MHRLFAPLGLTLALSTGLMFALTPSQAAAQADHLQCYKIKDALAKGVYTADITPDDLTFPASAGCTIKTPAKLLCVDAVKSNVAPVPPGADPGSAAQKYLCYKAKCPKNQPTATLDDQFGTHALEVKTTSMLCAPVPEAAPSCSDNVQNGNETDIDCGGGCPPCTAGQGCSAGSDCTSFVCMAGVCQAASCSDGVQNGAESDIDCGGGSCSMCGNGSACVVASDCVSGTCQGSVCVELLADGAPCAQNPDCVSSICVDGVCCNAACAGTCQACTAAKKGSGSDGVCGNIGNGTDPDNECAGTCDGLGMCQP
ncbi:MAG: hypothetical protein ABR587_12670 [Candidatus Binatia bacterium]